MIRFSERERKRRLRERAAVHRTQLIEQGVELLRAQLSDDDLRRLTNVFWEVAMYDFRGALQSLVDGLDAQEGDEAGPDIDDAVEALRAAYRTRPHPVAGFDVLPADYKRGASKTK
jgi:hypothetical protein